MPSFTVSVTNASAERDGQAARDQVRLENEKRASEDPPGTPLPTSTNQELLASYEIVLGQTIASAHESYVQQAAVNSANSVEAKDRWAISTDAQRQASVDELEPLPA